MHYTAFSARLCAENTCASTAIRQDYDPSSMQPRRERYVFRPILLKLLEEFFHENAYPDLGKRMEVAHACNQALALEKAGAEWFNRAHWTRVPGINEILPGIPSGIV